MEKYEKVSIIVLCYALLIISLSGMYAIFCGILLLVWLGAKKDKVSFIMILLMIVMIHWNCYNKTIENNREYAVKMYIDKNIEIKSINGKNVVNKVYFKNSLIENNIGYYKAKIRVNKISNYKNSVYLEGEILSFEESYFNKYRKMVENLIERTNYSFEIESFVKAIVLGERANLSGELEENYRKTGATHILSISGLHISIIIVIFLNLFHHMGFTYRNKYLLTMIFLTGYILLLGNNPAVIRSYIMGFIYLLSKIFYEKSSLKKSFCLSFIICTIVNPFVIKDISFEMSYSAMFGIIYIYEKFCKKDIYYNAILLSFLIQLVLLPMTIYYFHTLSVYTFLFNIFILVWGDILINLIFLTIFLEIFRLGFVGRELVRFFYEVLDVFIKFCASFPYSSLTLDKSLGVWFFISMLIAAFLLVRDYKISFYMIMALIILYNILPNIEKKEIKSYSHEKIVFQNINFTKV